MIYRLERMNEMVKTMKKGFAANLEEATRKNTDFRRVLYTGKFSQLVLMCLKPKEDIGEETHDDVDRFFRFDDGVVVVVIDVPRSFRGFF
jgi:mannose-6-phosphate isomerase-like protein (cupin superfamily)